MCHRDFDQQNEVDSLVEELMGKIREVPTRLQENKNQLEEKQMKYNKMLELRSKYEQISSFREAEIPHLRSELENVGSLIKKVQKELSDVGNEINSLQSVEALCISLQVRHYLTKIF